MRLVLLLVLMFQWQLAVAQGTGRPVGKNCNLSAPPESAGEELNHGIILRIYPRAKDINEMYTGCQLMWLPDANRWHVLSVVEIKSGDPVRIWSPDKSDPVRVSCTYRKGKVVKGDAKNCAGPEFLIAKSMAPGCVKKVAQAVEKGGITTPGPPGCEYE